jgi:hypothetical protein
MPEGDMSLWVTAPAEGGSISFSALTPRQEALVLMNRLRRVENIDDEWLVDILAACFLGEDTRDDY